MPDEQDFLTSSPLADNPVLLAKARTRGEALGFTDIFLKASLDGN
jgi:hypothetical protein